ncbi:hypothetical protein [Noviherbaspirillum cavernae]|nr:hypothetical protein [Noviherbaspirillum cavernae]
MRWDDRFVTNMATATAIEPSTTTRKKQKAARREPGGFSML